MITTLPLVTNAIVAEKFRQGTGDKTPKKILFRYSLKQVRHVDHLDALFNRKWSLANPMKSCEVLLFIFPEPFSGCRSMTTSVIIHVSLGLSYYAKGVPRCAKLAAASSGLHLASRRPDKGPLLPDI